MLGLLITRNLALPKDEFGLAANGRDGSAADLLLDITPMSASGRYPAVLPGFFEKPNLSVSFHQ